MFLVTHLRNGNVQNLNASDHGRYSANINSRFIVNLLVECTIFLTQCSRITFVNSGEWRVATITAKCSISSKSAFRTCV